MRVLLARLLCLTRVRSTDMPQRLFHIPNFLEEWCRQAVCYHQEPCVDIPGAISKCVTEIGPRVSVLMRIVLPVPDFKQDVVETIADLAPSDPCLKPRIECEGFPNNVKFCLEHVKFFLRSICRMNAVAGQGGIDKSEFKMSGDSEPEIIILARGASDSLVKSSHLHQTLLT